jgi:hypothetical protein
MYDIFYISKFKDATYCSLLKKYPFIKHAVDISTAQKKSFTKMFWATWNDLDIVDNFDFNFEPPKWDQKYIHVFKKNDLYEGVCLIPKVCSISKREMEYRFFTNKKEIDILSARPAPYDIVFISYNEVHADKNYLNLLNRFPNAKRVHGVKGIHQAHIEAAKLVSTELFWVVDGDAVILDTFDFSYFIPYRDFDTKLTVHVWKSSNPINGLEYGYGGVKLLPTKLTLEVDINSTDMTTSISDKFKSVNQVSNITAFNTDPFSTWRSAFRECAKLASKSISRQNSDETEERLRIWSTQGVGSNYWEYAHAGASAAIMFVKQHPDMLNKINDFDWLFKKFNGEV